MPISKAVLDKADPPATSQKVVLAPDQLIVPGTYRMMVVDGRTVLVRETDARKVLTSPAVQIVAADQSGTDLSLQPALLPQEVSEEIVRNRAQTDAALRVLPGLMAEQRRQAEELRRLREAKTQPQPNASSTEKPATDGKNS